jgi:DNA repair exonuclease SbcCD ATPase subunit
MSGFQFHRVEVDQFQQFRKPVVIEGLEAGLNVIAGENEAGKSTLLRAVRAALFDRYRSNVGEHYRPHGAAVSPSVKLDFTVAGQKYHLEKTFSKKKDGGLVLQADDGRRWEGPEAEDYLAELLGFAYPGKGASRPELQGLAGLLWVEQGCAHDPVHLNDENRNQVQGVFEQEMRDLLGGDRGEVLFRRIQTLRDQYFDKRGNPRGDYRKLQQRAEGLAEKLEQARQELGTYEKQVDQLGKLERKLQEYRDDHLVEGAEQRVRELQEVTDRIAKLRARISDGEKAVAQAELAWERAQQARETRRAGIEAVEEAQAMLEAAIEKVQRLEGELGPIEKQRNELQAVVDTLNTRRRELERDLQRARDAQALQRIGKQRDELAQRLEKAEQLDARRRAALAEQAALRVGEEDLAALQALERECDLAEERLRAVATRVEYALEEGVQARLGDRLIAGADEVLLTEETGLQIEGVGQFRIRPGGEDLGQLRDRLAAQKEKLARRLLELGVESVAEAQRQVRRHNELGQEAKQAGAELNGVAPDGGLPALRDEMQAVAARVEALREQLGEGDGRDLDLAVLEDEVRALSAEIATQEAKLAGYREGASRLQGQLESARMEQKDAERTLEGRREALSDDRAKVADDQLAQEATRAAQELERQRQALQVARDALAAEEPDAIAAEIERAERVLEDLKAEKATLEREVVQLRATLEALGQQGLAEQVAKLETEYAQVRRELEHEDRRARALELLVETLEASLQRAREAVARPVVERLVVYLRQLIPGAEPEIDETLGLVGLRRDGVMERFEQLSIGTREQLAVLVRLAYADLLAEAGVPVSVVLDDALVNSDDERRDRMKRILFQAAKRYQIVLLTCHGREYRDAGGYFVRLED